MQEVGVYLCVVTRRSIQSTRHLRISVAVKWLVGNNQLISVENLFSGPPRVSEKVVHRQTVRIGRTMKLQCPVEGDPPPLIMWSKDGRNIHSGWMRFRVTHQALRIKEVEAEDAGTFNCKATNGFGSVNINYTLIVIGELLGFLYEYIKLKCSLNKYYISFNIFFTVIPWK